MSKFKVGDKVKLKDDLVIYETYGGVTLLSSMKFVGAKVIHWLNDELIKFEENGYIYCEEMLEHVQDNSIKSILFNNPYTTVLFNDGTKSTVKCHVNDEFDEYQGFVNAVAKHTLQMSGLEIAELIESKAKRKYPKQINDDVIRVGDKVLYFNKEYYVTHIDDDLYHAFPYKLSKRKEDVGLDVSQLKQKYGYQDATWAVSSFKDIIKVKSK